ncbi:serine/threonine protein kinase [Trichormus variabilis ATCC 29413]|uniref:Serine/threonine protein kinase n=2 Tax=Anabaena variabilis TaxID=264691 RepID=Q3MG26_TRIV2|nr:MULTISPECIES: right-handed parallel beta-helix repeat-containing protein [Nostocaceae]ABA20060.1 serine/threonine protein kinase [Trichormus variabilis ATCC 29413]MBC1215942.1 right-handed parallel beta-helix repeat-containing protein [Trichormus variabilis ARAD]MBC1255012.1 right-handed parallel beta-helix repeat-containing protein [Trichormus variabilis V5]MBC1266982.1 right-handed parallel beta-helix repeat-containing protein [Trichormus variabilis FSR]MBC1303920.1 right-handed parallel 
MSLCINPQCSKPQNPDNVLFCQNCGSELLLEGRYRVVSVLGGGGFGKTFAVNDTRTQTAKVLKVLINNHPKAVELFQREAEVLALLNYPGIPTVEANGYFVYFPRNSQEPMHCLVMEKIEGLDLGQYLRQRDYRPIDQKLALQWFKEVMIILHQVHQQGLFHRDIKPSNIMLRADGRLVLIDFGTARSVTGTYIAKQAVGQVTGVISAGYTPSEQINGQAVQQSDFFALGRTFIYLLTGKEPSDPTIYNYLNDELRWRDGLLSSGSNSVTPTVGDRPNILPQFADLLDQMMERLPAQRPQNTHIILQRLADIEKSLQPPPPPPPKPKGWTRRRLIAVVGFSSLGLTGALALSRLLPKTTLIVSQEGGGDYKTISAAIENAQPGMRILVRPGLYQESLVLDKALKIIGDGVKAEIIIESKDAGCLVVKTDQAEVRGLTFRSRVGTENKQYFAVDISQGQVILADCDITSDSLSGIGVHGATANPVIQKCQIHDGKQSGIYLYENSRGTIEDCDFFGNTTTEITVDAAQPIIRRCKIHQDKEGGILFRNQAQGIVEDCDIFNNNLSGIEIRDSSNPTIQKCRIHDNQQGDGILVHLNGRGTVEDCNIFSNGFSGVEIRDRGNPVIRRCSINKNKYYGVYAYKNSTGTVENCDLTGNIRSAINVDETSQLQRSGNVE